MRLLIIVQTYILQKLTYSTIKQLNEVDLLERGNPRLVTTGEEKRGAKAVGSGGGGAQALGTRRRSARVARHLATRADVAGE